MDKFARFWGFGLLLIPFIFYKGVTVRFIYPKIFFLQAWVALGLIFYSFKKTKESTIKLGPVSLTALGLLGFSFISLFYSPDLVVGLFGPFWRGTGLIFYASIFLGGLVLIESFKVPKEKFALGLIYTGYAISTIVLISYFFTLNIEKAVYIIVGNRNPLAFWVGVTILLSYLYRETIPKNLKPMAYVFSLISLVVLILLGSRSSIGGLFISLILIGLLSEKKYLKISLGVSSLAAAGLGLQYFLAKNSILAALIVRTKQFNRSGIWEGAFDSFLAKPIGGYGMHGLIQGYWENYTSTLDKGHSWNENAHSIILNMAGELGSIGLILFLALCIFVFKSIKQKDEGMRAGWWGLYVFTLLYALTQPFFVDTVLLVVFLLFLLGESESFLFSSDNLPWKGAKVLLAVGLSIVTYFQYSQIGQLNETRSQIAKHSNYRKVWKELDKKTPYIDKVGAFFELQSLLVSSFAKVKPGETELDKEIRGRSKRFIREGLDNLMKDHSHRPRLLRSYALTAIQENDLDKALKALDILLSRSDQITEMYYYKAVIFAKQRRNKEAKQMLLKVKELNPNYVGIDEQLAKLKNY